MTDQGPWHVPGSSDTTLSLSRHWHSFPATSCLRSPVSGVWPWWSQWFNLRSHSRLTTCTPLNVNVRVQSQAETRRDTKHCRGPGTDSHRLTPHAWAGHTSWEHETQPIWVRCLSSRSRDCPSWRYRDKSHSVTEPVTSSLCPVRSGSDYGWDKLDPGTGHWLYWRFWHDMIYKYKHWASDDNKSLEKEKVTTWLVTIWSFLQSMLSDIHTFTRINVIISFYSIFSES